MKKISLQHYFFSVSYDGTSYQGWQKQIRTKATIQTAIEKSLKEFLGGTDDIKIIGASRTDSGVHAHGQVFKAKLPSHIPKRGLIEGINTKLPSDIRILDAKKVHEDSHPIAHAIYKEYRYYFSFDPLTSPLARTFIGAPPKGRYTLQDIEDLPRIFEGVHNFQNFYCKGTAVKSTIREIYHSRIFPLTLPELSPIGSSPQIYVFQVQGNGFLKQMVRLMMGTIYSLSSGKVNKKKVLTALQGKMRPGEKLGAVASPCGLNLHKVHYPSDLFC